MKRREVRGKKIERWYGLINQLNAKGRIKKWLYYGVIISKKRTMGKRDPNAVEIRER